MICTPVLHVSYTRRLGFHHSRLAWAPFWLITGISLFIGARIKRESLPPVKTRPYFNVSKTSGY